MVSKCFTLRQSVRLPPVLCAPHSMMWPATMPAASRSQSSGAHPKRWIIGASVMPVSVQRPVTTMRAPLRRPSTTGQAP